MREMNEIEGMLIMTTITLTTIDVSRHEEALTYPLFLSALSASHAR
jgi:hypothetical protein